MLNDNCYDLLQYFMWLYSYMFVFTKEVAQMAVNPLVILLLWLLWVARAALGLAQRTDGRIAMYLLVARQTRFHWRWLLSVNQ